MHSNHDQSTAFHRSESTEEHRSHAQTIRFAVLTVSDTRTPENDPSGMLIREHLGFRGHDLAGYTVVPDESGELERQLEAWLADPSIGAIIVNGGTGISGRDITYPTITRLIDKPLPGFGELFRMLSWEEVGAASMLSRATAGLHEQTLIFSLPGSVNAVRLAMEKLIGPELGHIVYEVRKNG